MLKLPLALEHALLGFLRERPMHAYEMHQRLRRADVLGRVWRLKQSQLYALLARLEEAGYISGTLEEQEARPARRVLHLTEAGQAAFDRWLLAPVEHGRDFRIEFLAKLFFAQRDGPAAVATLLERQRAVCRRLLVELRDQLDQQGTPVYERLVVEFRIGQVDAILRWLDICAEELGVRPG
ncbi:MAG TPA: PadR family transcriptional regulator [Roseiflexaceae bacterium]|nr:PadR family transcriptional regulator [Roseiflexaceae bacterium]